MIVKCILKHDHIKGGCVFGGGFEMTKEKKPTSQKLIPTLTAFNLLVYALKSLGIFFIAFSPYRIIGGFSFAGGLVLELIVKEFFQ